MSKPKRLSGSEIISILERFSFKLVHQRGSHIKMTRVINGEKQTLTIAAHKELKTGAIVAIFRQASRYISESDLREFFYSK